MLSNCLKNYIGIRHLCTDSTPESGLYINDLQSVNITNLASLATSEQKNFMGVYNEITTRALNEFEADVMNKAQKFFKTNVLIENNKSGFFTDPYETVTASTEFKGVAIELRDNISNYLSIFINTAQIYLDAAGTKEVLIYNTLNGSLMDTISFEGVEGMNRVNINKSYPTYGQDTNIFVCYNAVTTGSISVDNIDYSNNAIIRGAKVSNASSVIDSNLVYDGDSYGLVVDYNIKCDISEFICSSRDVFKFALWYKFGAAIMFDRLDSDRMNKFTLNKTPLEIKELYKFYDKKYNEAMDSILNNLDANEDAVCFTCNKARSYKYLKP
jgi:hypothetical protein